MSEATRAQTLSFCVPESEHNRRLDLYLRDAAQLSRSQVQALVRGGSLVLRRGGKQQIVRQAAGRLAAGDQLQLVVPRAAVQRAINAPLMPQPMALNILFEDEHVLVLDKPAGLVVHPAPGHREGTLVHGLLAHCGKNLSRLGGPERPGIVHRLDKDTSGALTVAKHDDAHRRLAAQFAAHKHEQGFARLYDALVWGAPHPPQGRLDQPLGRHPRARQKQAVRKPDTGGRAACTLYRTRLVWGAGLVSRLRCRLLSGRTHQIRVHLAHAGHPVLGDALYGRRQQTKARRLPPAAQKSLKALNRHALHARELAFCHPQNGQHMRFVAPLPTDMKAVLRALDRDLTRTRLTGYDRSMPAEELV